MNKHPEGGEGVEHCGYCNGQGWVESVGDHCTEDGEYIGSEPIQVECPACDGSGTTQKPDEEPDCSECGGEMGCEVCAPEGWPVVWHFRNKGDGTSAGFTYDGSVAKSNLFYDVETYYPQSHPALLSPDEARLLYVSPAILTDEEMRRRERLTDRLQNFAAKEGRDA